MAYGKKRLSLLAAQLASVFYGGAGCIFALHRVIPEARRSPLALNRELEITPEHLDTMLQAIRRWRYDLIGIDEVPERLANRNGSRFVCFTFDDGYRDNLEFALPVFQAHGAPLAIYVTTSFVERGLVWWYGLEALLLRLEAIAVRDATRETIFPLRTIEEKNHALAKLSDQIRNQGAMERDEYLGRLFKQHGTDPYAAAKELILTWEELNRMSVNTLVTVGAHSVGHHVLTKLSNVEARQELTESRSELEAKLGKKVEHFSFPFGTRGSVGEREVELAKECGFKTAVTSRAGSVFPQHLEHLHCLPRRRIEEDTDELRKKILGWSNFRRTPGQRVVRL